MTQLNIKNLRRPRVVAALFIVGVVFLAVCPLYIYPIYLAEILCFALFAASFNMLIGYVGLLSFGHAAFFGGAAYAASLAIKTLGVTPELGVLAGALFSTCLGLIFGAIAIRRRGIYFSMVTLALAQMFYFFCVQAPWTGGENGIQHIPRGKALGYFSLESGVAIYYFTLVIVVACGLAIYRIINSPFGNILKALRDNEPRAISLGYSVQRYKLVAFALSAGFAGIAGSLKALIFQLATLVDVEWQTSGDVVMMTLLGGIGTHLGPLVGAGLVVSIQNGLATSNLPVKLIVGIVFVICVMAFQKGIVGIFISRFTRPGANPEHMSQRSGN